MIDESSESADQGSETAQIIGFTGLKQQGGVIYEEFLTRLQGSRGVQTYTEMCSNSSVIGTIRFLIKVLVRQVAWDVKPADDSPAAIDQASFIKECLKDMSQTFEDFVSETLSFLEYGWSFFEIVYKLRKGPTEDSTTKSRYNDGKWGWRKFAVRGQSTLSNWVFDPEDDGIKGMYQQDWFSGRAATIPIEKAILFRTELNKNNPEGRSIFRNAFEDWYRLKEISRFEATGIERELCGIPVMQVPSTMLSDKANDAEKAIRRSIEKMLGQFKNDERAYAMIPSELNLQGQPTGYKLSLMASGGSRQIDTVEVKKQYKLSILQTVLAQFVELGTQGVGSFSLASSQTNLFSVALGTFLDIISSTFTKYAINRLMAMNQVAEELWPSLTHGDIEAPNLKDVADYVLALSNAGQLPLDDKPLQNKLLTIGGLPIPAANEE